nr:MAG TPA: hypothetical protein [Inoviridae sp.]
MSYYTFFVSKYVNMLVCGMQKLYILFNVCTHAV